jgi:hypothetical protein
LTSPLAQADQAARRIDTEVDLVLEESLSSPRRGVDDAAERRAPASGAALAEERLTVRPRSTALLSAALVVDLCRSGRSRRKTM